MNAAARNVALICSLAGHSIVTNDCIKFKYEKTFFVMISIKRFYDSSMSTAPETQWIY